jgi:hypothetical protein
LSLLWFLWLCPPGGTCACLHLSCIIPCHFLATLWPWPHHCLSLLGFQEGSWCLGLCYSGHPTMNLKRSP